MDNKEFAQTIIKAVEGDPTAVQKIIDQYEPLINKYSKRNGIVDEDCKQHLRLAIVEKIKKFNIFL